LQVTRAKAFHQTLIVRTSDEGASADHGKLSLGAANLDRLGETLKPGVTLVFDSAPGFCGPRVGRAAVWIAEVRVLRRSLKSFTDRIVV
jgi:ribosomal protein L19E